MTRVQVTVDVSEEDVKTMLWLLHGHAEYEEVDSPLQGTLMRLKDYGMLDEKIVQMRPGLAHCYFTGLEEGGEETLLGYLEAFDN